MRLSMPDFLINSLAEANFSLTDTDIITSKPLGILDHFWHSDVSWQDVFNGIV